MQPKQKQPARHQHRREWSEPRNTCLGGCLPVFWWENIFLEWYLSDKVTRGSIPNHYDKPAILPGGRSRAYLLRRFPHNLRKSMILKEDIYISSSCVNIWKNSFIFLVCVLLIFLTITNDPIFTNCFPSATNPTPCFFFIQQHHHISFFSAPLQQLPLQFYCFLSCAKKGKPVLSVLDSRFKEAMSINTLAYGPGGKGGSPPQNLGNSDFLGSKRKFGQSQCFFMIIILKR